MKHSMTRIAALIAAFGSVGQAVAETRELTLDSVVVTLFGAVTSSVTVNAISAEPFGADVTGGYLERAGRGRCLALLRRGAGALVGLAGLYFLLSPLAAGS